MEVKKNPNKDLHRQSSKFFLIGFSISVGLVIMAFEWRTVKKEIAPYQSDIPLEATIEVLPTQHEQAIVPPATPKDVMSISHKSIQALKEVDIPLLDEPSLSEEYTSPRAGIPEIPVETTEDILLFPEVKPIPTGGYESFYSLISKSLKYPQQAKRNHTEGKVFVEFVVDQTGQVTNLKILKGIGSGCDEEALRVIAQTRWEAGRQRGKPVKVRMVIPINFKLK